MSRNERVIAAAGQANPGTHVLAHHRRGKCSCMPSVLDAIAAATTFPRWILSAFDEFESAVWEPFLREDASSGDDLGVDRMPALAAG